MKRETMFNLLLVLVLILALMSGSEIVHPARAQEPVPQAVLAPQADVSTTFTYQGRLTNSSSGDPIAGSCDFQFGLWDDGLAGSQVGSTQTSTNVNLDNGYFGVALDFGAPAFTGEARYLQIAARCPAGSGGYTPLSGRVELTAAPYALSLRPGANISGNSTGNMLSAQNSSSIGGGIYGQVAGPSGLTPLTGAGVWGDSASVPGMVGTSHSATGVFGWSVSNDGVSGLSTSGYGVYGASITNKAIYSAGDAHVEGNLTWKAKTSYISIPAAAFTAKVDPSGRVNEGYWLSNTNGGTFYAPVQLPHDATVTGMTFYWYDNSYNNITCTLRVDSMAQIGPMDTVMAQVVSTSGSFGFGSTGSISEAAIDNQHYIYYLKWEMPTGDGSDLAGLGVVIDYTITEPY